VATLRVGDVQITRVEESYGPGFRASMLMPKFDLAAVENHRPDVFAQFMQLDTQTALLSVHTWVVRTLRPIDTHAKSELAATGLSDDPEEFCALVGASHHLWHLGKEMAFKRSRVRLPSAPLIRSHAQQVPESAAAAERIHCVSLRGPHSAGPRPPLFP
jgi:hypothetical protein